MLKRDLYYESIPTKSLRDDVRYLGNILGKVIKKQEGDSFFNLVEKIRLLSKANSANCNVFPVGTNTLKEVLFARLRVKEPGPAFWHIPDHFDEEFCYQLTAEKAVKRYSKGIPRIEYIKLRPRNEALDLAVLNLAAFAMLNVNTNAVQKRLQDQRKQDPKQKTRTRKSWVSGVSHKRRF